ncbi:tetratricopeptide repeat protein [Helicobacter pylori]|uniref:tetratricopeptide repeat protein n=1 Tax=Helicobacter pylori TaxID=210 RepID=UPI001EDB3B7D|nr:tetratricopeptide repeat protein [Helicobacter pylori]MCG3024811.1 sel1 repeat family protein [Helicobacter pylori]
MAEPNPKELFDLGVKSIEAKDYIQAKKCFEKACDLKYGGGCYWLGAFHESGGGTVKKDLKKAIQYYVKACELNEMFGCLSLVSNSQINKQKLFQYLSKACELNSGNGCRFLGDFYENGKYVKKDLRKAAQYYSKACKLGVQEICEMLEE